MPDCLYITGGTPLRGNVTLSGCKNGALPILAASLLVPDEVVLHNVPDISDIAKMCDLIRALGATVKREGGTVRINAAHLTSSQADRELMAAMRASLDVVAPLVARLGHAEVPLPGGCAIGSRPVDYVFNALQELGMQVEEETDVMVCTAPQGLHGAVITLDPIYRAVRATFNVTMAATLADGKTVIENPTVDPEMENLCAFLRAAGAQIDGVGTSRVTIHGGAPLHGCEHTILSDRIEAGTYLLAGAVTKGEVRVSPIPPWYLNALLDKLEEMGLAVLREENAVTVRYQGRAHGATVYTSPFPGFPTDLQPHMVVLMCLAEGRSAINETIYDGRLNYVQELRRMGASIKLENSRQASITGVDALEGRTVEGADMRAGAAFVLAALAAHGESTVAGLHYIQRGYERLEEKLARLGAHIRIDHLAPDLRM